jgi:hypothetical protein
MCRFDKKKGIMKNTSAVTNLSAAKLEAMFNLCGAFNIDVESAGVIISDCNYCESMITVVDAKYYEEAIRESFHKYVKMYASVMGGEFKVLNEEIEEVEIIKHRDSVLDENGQVVNDEYLLEILDISEDLEDFLFKVNNGITNEDNYVSISNNMRIQAFYKKMIG